MKKLAVVVAVVLGLVTTSLADNVTPSASKGVEVSFNAMNQLLVSVAGAQQSGLTVNIYTRALELLHSENMGEKDVKLFDLKQLPLGSYVVEVQKDNTVLYTTVVKNIR